MLPLFGCFIQAWTQKVSIFFNPSGEEVLFKGPSVSGSRRSSAICKSLVNFFPGTNHLMPNSSVSPQQHPRRGSVCLPPTPFLSIIDTSSLFTPPMSSPISNSFSNGSDPAFGDEDVTKSQINYGNSVLSSTLKIQSPTISSKTSSSRPNSPLSTRLTKRKTYAAISANNRSSQSRKSLLIRPKTFTKPSRFSPNFINRSVGPSSHLKGCARWKWVVTKVIMPCLKRLTIVESFRPLQLINDIVALRSSTLENEPSSSPNRTAEASLIDSPNFPEGFDIASMLPEGYSVSEFESRLRLYLTSYNKKAISSLSHSFSLASPSFESESDSPTDNAMCKPLLSPSLIDPA